MRSPLPSGNGASRGTFRAARAAPYCGITWAGSFEGYTTIGLGVRARLPFRVLVLDGPVAGSRIVVDVAHQW
jgi:hypothetical protein